MHHRLSSAALVLFSSAAIAFLPAAAGAQRGTYSSRSHGPTLGVSLAGVGLTAEGSGSARDISGAGIQAELGWHKLTSHFGVLVDYVNITFDRDDTPPVYRGYNHIGALGRYAFRSDRDIVRPYLEIGLNRREVTARPGGTGTPSARTQGVAGVIGGGMQVFLARPVSLDFGLQLSMGGFGDWKNDDNVVGGIPELNQASGVFRFGVRFWPGY